MKTVPVFRPLLEREEFDAVNAALELGWLGMGSYVGQFEAAVGDVCGCPGDDDRRVVAVSTGHAALHLSLLLMGVGPGDEVITPSFNNTADFQAIRACGADPVFVDIRKDTLCVDHTRIESLIGPRTRCIIAMDYDIFTCDHEAIAAIAARHGVPVLHDAAHSFGSRHAGRPIGLQHAFTVFSFDPVKTVTCIDGGAIIVRGEEQASRLQAMRLIGMTQPAVRMYENARAWTYDVQALGFRYHMANLHAALGLAQVRKLPGIRESRQVVCRRYAEALAGLPWLEAPSTDFSTVAPFLYYVRVLNGRRDDFRAHMATCGVDTGIHWQAGHRFSYFQGCRSGPLDVTEEIVEQIVSLPLHSHMADTDVTRVVDAVRSFS